MAYENLRKNEKPMRFIDYDYTQNLKNLDFKSFPLIEDFETITKDCGKFLGVHLYFNSQELGLIASFPWWDNVNKKLKEMETQDIPVGTVDNPFNDLEQGWQILIFQKRDYVYVMQGEDPCCTEFPIWFKVRKEKYFEEWVKTLQKYKEGPLGF